MLSALAGLPATAGMLTDVSKLEREYFERVPDLDDPYQMVSFGPSGHRGSPLRGSFTESHILALTQAVCDFRRRVQITTGPLYLGKDTHALSGPAERTALQVLAGNSVETVIQRHDGVTPTPVISRSILVHNRKRKDGLADGILISPSHNPPEDGGFKYNAPDGGPPNTNAAHWVETRANELLRGFNAGVKRAPMMTALLGSTTHHEDFVTPYVRDLRNVVDMDAIRAAGLKLAVDPLGGAAKPYWESISSLYGLDIAIVNPVIDPRFAFMTVDSDGVIRMDCSSPYAMARALGKRNQYQLAFGNDPDGDRHGIVTPSGLMNPNDYLSVAIRYLLSNRPNWRTDAVVGKTFASTDLIDRVVRKMGRHLCEVPVGFHWFTQGLLDGAYCFCGEESAGASLLRLDGSPWTTDRDGPVMNLLAAEITARTGKDPSEHYRELTAEFGTTYYKRIQAPATPKQKSRLERITPSEVRESQLAGQPILAKLTRATGNNAPIGGLKVVAAAGWFAARPSSTENSYRIYAESLYDEAHLEVILGDAQEIVMNALGTTEKP
jgi:phosphoglucomutase